MSTATLAPPAPEKTDNAQKALDQEAARLRREASRDFGEDRPAQLHHRAALLSEAAGINPKTGEPRFTTEDVLHWVADAEALGASHPNLGPSTIERVFRLELIPNEPIRRAFVDQRPQEDTDRGHSSKSLAEALGIFRRDSSTGEQVGDGTTVDRLLGLRTTPGRPGYSPTLRTFVKYDQAVAFANALGLDYHDLGV